MNVFKKIPFLVLIAIICSVTYAEEKNEETDIKLTYIICNILETKIYATECDISGWHHRIDATIDVGPSDAREICDALQPISKRLYQPWEMRIFSPYSGKRPIAKCVIG